jgi:hypothetical protein
MMFSDEDLVVARDFVLKGLPWDLSRPRFMDRQREQIAEKIKGEPAFAMKLRHVAMEALESDQPSVIRCGLTVLAFVGTNAELSVIERLKSHADARVSKDARTCVFEIEKHGPTRSITKRHETPNREKVGPGTITPRGRTGTHLCPICRGSGLDPAMNRRGKRGHDDRTCAKCAGQGYVDAAEESDS